MKFDGKVFRTHCNFGKPAKKPATKRKVDLGKRFLEEFRENMSNLLESKADRKERIFSFERGHKYDFGDISIYRYPCDKGCGRRFKRKDNMKRHVKRCKKCPVDGCGIYLTQIIFSVLRLS